MTLTDPETTRILDWEGCFNVRDLGGLPTADGRKRIRWGALVRSDLVCRLTANGRESLKGHGVRTIVDLRFRDEVESDWHLYPFQDADSRALMGYRHVPFNHGRNPALEEQVRAAYRAATSRIELNRNDVDWNATGIAAAVAAIADAAPGGVLVHCHAGKDRTGMVVAVLLSALGIKDDDIADDYALTALTLEPLIADWLNETSQDPDEREFLRALALPAREAMLDTLAYLRERHGSAEAFLMGGGLSPAQLAALRDRLLEAA